MKWIEVKSTDFHLGKDDLKNLTIRDSGLPNGLFYFFDSKSRRLIKQFVLEESKTGIKTCVVVTLIKKGEKYTPRLEFSKRDGKNHLINEIDTSKKAQKIRSRIDFEKCHENFWELIDFIRSFKEIDIPKSGWSAIDREQKEKLKNFEMSSDFIDKVMRTFSTKAAQDLLIRAKQYDVQNLHAAIKQAKNKQALNELNKIIDGRHSESQLQEWISKNDWVFGIEYIRKLNLRTIGIGSSSDFVVESLDGFADLIELKKADQEHLFNYDESHDSYYPTAELSKALGQTIFYLKTMNDNRLLLKEKHGTDVLKPRAKIVIGRSKKMGEEEKKALRLLNDSLHGIEVLTYDEINKRAETIIGVYEGGSREEFIIPELPEDF